MQTQGDRLFSALKKRPHTYMEMIGLGVSTCPWRRLREAESLPRNAGWQLVPGRRLVWVDGGTVFLTTWAVKRVRTA
jgi:hypothetical protein